MNITVPDRRTFSFGNRFITERAKIVLPDPDSPTTPSVWPRFERQGHSVDGAHPATRGQEVRLEVGDLEQLLGLRVLDVHGAGHRPVHRRPRLRMSNVQLPMCPPTQLTADTLTIVQSAL